MGEGVVNEGAGLSSLKRLEVRLCVMTQRFRAGLITFIPAAGLLSAYLRLPSAIIALSRWLRNRRATPLAVG